MGPLGSIQGVKEYILDDDDCPLAIERQHNRLKGTPCRFPLSSSLFRGSNGKCIKNEGRLIGLVTQLCRESKFVFTQNVFYGRHLNSNNGYCTG